MKEVVFIQKQIPTEFQIVESYIPVDFIIAMGKFLPTKFKKVKTPMPVKFRTITEPILIPKRHNQPSRA